VLPLERARERERGRAGERAATADPGLFASRVGDAVRRARQSHGWTQAELAERSGLSSNYVARLERGELGASLFVAHQLCDALGIDVSDLLQTGPARTGRRRVGG
jgi:transcriptional regulator with XRE-family HTH domain